MAQQFCEITFFKHELLQVIIAYLPMLMCV